MRRRGVKRLVCATHVPHVHVPPCWRSQTGFADRTPSSTYVDKMTVNGEDSLVRMESLLYQTWTSESSRCESVQN